MKNIILIFTLMVVTTSFFMMIFCESQLFAGMEGCCLVRNSTRSNWKVTTYSLSECRRLNDNADRDDLFAKYGIVCWDRNCRN